MLNYDKNLHRWILCFRIGKKINKLMFKNCRINVKNKYIILGDGIKINFSIMKAVKNGIKIKISSKLGKNILKEYAQ